VPAVIERKLTTILAADVEGYSRLMEADEVAAMAALQECRAVFARLIERHRGRIANTAGDGLLADFPSVVEAVQCAVEVQRELTARQRQRGEAAMRFRIGIHLGDVMVDRGDLFGEGVNMAARLQAMAEPGGVLISQAVYDQVHAKLAVGYQHLGERRAKNLTRGISAYRLVLDGSPPRGGEPARSRRQRPAEAAGPEADLGTRVVRHAQLLGILWAALAAVNLATSGYFWAIWPGIVIAVGLGLEAAPLLARGRLDVQLVRLAVIVAGLALINLASRSGEPWFLWPAGALLVAYLLRQTWRRAG
jgi:adenylate cyclase